VECRAEQRSSLWIFCLGSSELVCEKLPFSAIAVLFARHIGLFSKNTIIKKADKRGRSE